MTKAIGVRVFLPGSPFPAVIATSRSGGPVRRVGPNVRDTFQIRRWIPDRAQSRQFDLGLVKSCADSWSPHEVLRGNKITCAFNGMGDRRPAVNRFGPK
jgi:hypothetical protein